MCAPIHCQEAPGAGRLRWSVTPVKQARCAALHSVHIRAEGGSSPTTTAPGPPLKQSAAPSGSAPLCARAASSTRDLSVVGSCRGEKTRRHTSPYATCSHIRSRSGASITTT